MAREGEGRTALVTGASAGIGKAFAERLAAEGYQVVLTARRAERLQSLAEALTRAHGVAAEVVVADLADRSAPPALVEELVRRGRHVDLLVNNAGYGVPGRFDHPTWAEHEAFLQVMVGAVCELSYLLVPGMVERGWGRVINVASLAGHLPAPAGHTLYAASKAFVIRFSEALHAEYAAHGVHTTAVCPGFTLSEFHDVTGTRDKVSRMPGFMWMDAPTVARQGYAAVMHGTPVYINGRVNRTLAWLGRVLPQGMVRRAVSASGASYRRTD